MSFGYPKGEAWSLPRECLVSWEQERGLYFLHCCVEKAKDTGKSNNLIILLLTLLFLLSLLSFYGKLLLINPANCERRKKVINFSLLSRNYYKFNRIQLYQLNWFHKMAPLQIYRNSSFCLSCPFEINQKGPLVQMEISFIRDNICNPHYIFHHRAS